MLIYKKEKHLLTNLRKFLDLYELKDYTKKGGKVERKRTRVY